MWPQAVESGFLRRLKRGHLRGCGWPQRVAGGLRGSRVASVGSRVAMEVAGGHGGCRWP